MDHRASASASAPLPTMFTFCWTDHRLNLLKDCYYDCLMGSLCGAVRDLGSRERCLRQLKRAVNVKCTDVDDNCIEIQADDDTISKKLNELAEICGSRKEAGTRQRYIELKEILGENRCNKLKMLVQHEKFDYYSPLNEPSRRVAPATFVERGVLAFQKRNKFYWTDSKMQLLVTSYHSYLEKINNVTLTRGCRNNCLSFIKKSFGTVTFDELTRKFDQIFDAEEGKGVSRAQLRMRLGKETCGIFDKLLKNNPLYRTYYKPDVTSLSSLSSRKRSLTSRTPSSSIHRSESVQDQSDLNQEAATITAEDVCEILGVPAKGKAIPADISKEDNTKFKAKYDNRHFKDLISDLEHFKNADVEFKETFMILAFGLFFCPSTKDVYTVQLEFS